MTDHRSQVEQREDGKFVVVPTRPNGAEPIGPAPLASPAPNKRRAIFIVAGVGIAAVAAVVVVVVVLSGDGHLPPSDAGEAALAASTDGGAIAPAEDLNRAALGERAEQDAAKEEKGETYVKDVYRTRWRDNPNDPLAVYLYVRAVETDDAVALLAECTRANPGFAWCWHSLSKHYADEKKWTEASEAAERAMALFDATDIQENHRWLTRVNGAWYEAWTGKRSASFSCETPKGNFVFRVREKGRGTECPDVCVEPDMAALCYDVSWMTEAGGWQLDPTVFGFRMDDGDKWAMTGWFDSDGNLIADGPTTNFGVATAVRCVPAERSVVSAEYWNNTSCKGQYVLRDLSAGAPLAVSAATQREFGAIRTLVEENTPDHMRVPDLLPHDREEQAALVEGYQEGWRTGKTQWQRRWMIFATGGGIGATTTELARAVRSAASGFSWEWDCFVHHSERNRGGALRIYCSTEYPERYDFSILTFSRHSGLEPGTHIRFGKIGLGKPDEDDDGIMMFGGTNSWDPRLRVEVVE